jgi:N-acetylglucosaminyl-diphospho-decaprenol L-rhamnosyltransferase
MLRFRQEITSRKKKSTGVGSWRRLETLVIEQNSRVAILIVGYRNPQDVRACLAALSRLTPESRFDVLICENGGREWFEKLNLALLDPQGPCRPSEHEIDFLAWSDSRLVGVNTLVLKDRPARVWIGCAAENLGYAGGVNVWIETILVNAEWNGIWVLNPDSEPEPAALQALIERSTTGNKGMVGSTIVPTISGGRVHCRAGHHWRKSRTNLALIGFGEPLDAAVDLQDIEAKLDCIAGGSMYLTRECLEKIGPMDERFFLFYEDADWSVRAKQLGLGYAPDSIVPHKGGTTIGSARLRADRSRLSVYLESRNHIHFVRLHWRRYLPLAIILSCVYATTYLVAFAPKNFIAAVQGLWAGLRGETGRPLFLN